MVEPAPRGRQPTWGGYIPQFLGHTLCQTILDILTVDDSYGYLGREAAELLDQRRAAMRDVLEPRRGGIEEDDNEIRWWTFAGGRINSTLRHAVSAINGEWTDIPDNFVIKVRGPKLTLGHFMAIRDQLRNAEFWEDEDRWRTIADTLPGYRLSKFQPLMPPWVEREIVSNYLLDVSGSQRWMADVI